MFIWSRSKHVTELDALCACVHEATERKESFWVLKCGKAVHFLPWWEWGELIRREHRCLVLDVRLLQSSGRCVHKSGDPQKQSVILHLTKLALAGGCLQCTSGQRLGTVTRSRERGSGI